MESTNVRNISFLYVVLLDAFDRRGYEPTKDLKAAVFSHCFGVAQRRGVKALSVPPPSMKEFGETGFVADAMRKVDLVES